jgi:hypothetical protein
MCENLKSLSICNQGDIQQQALGPEGIQSAQQRGGV